MTFKYTVGINNLTEMWYQVIKLINRKLCYDAITLRCHMLMKKHVGLFFIL